MSNYGDSEREPENNESEKTYSPSSSDLKGSIEQEGSLVTKPAMSEKALQMMQRMGYEVGSGLGKNSQGIRISIPFSTNLGRRGFGHEVADLNYSNDEWNFSQDDIEIEEKIEWLTNANPVCFTKEEQINWIIEGSRITSVENSNFCDNEVLDNVFKAKTIFDELSLSELYKARSRANAFETIGAVFFMNRAALKMANIDAATDFIFTNMENQEEFKTDNEPIYFADVCAGPGGFTEYILWRKKWKYKGFGLTLKDEHDFKVGESKCVSGSTFQALYGSAGDGNVCNPENLSDFMDKVKHETSNKGVHFMMSDGGFCVNGNENLQEVLSKNIYLCQCLLALLVLRPHGSFVTKLFDVFTDFSVGLLYLMFLCFEKVGILKPKTSRPANSERYFVCNRLNDNSCTTFVREHLWNVAKAFWSLQGDAEKDILEIIPLDIVKADQCFVSYIVTSNKSIGKKQIRALKKLAQFCRNPSLVEARQSDLRIQCLRYWNIPDKKRKNFEILTIDDILQQLHFNFDLLKLPPKCPSDEDQLKNVLSQSNNWMYCNLYSSERIGRTHLFVATGNSKVYRLQGDKWAKVHNLELIPGTLLFGEFVKETSVLEDKTESHRYSLHIIDAVCLGSKNLETCSFKERTTLIELYCKAVNRESQLKYSIRIRPKPLKSFSDVNPDTPRQNSGNLVYSLPLLGYKANTEYYEVNSMLLLPTEDNHTFVSSYVSRVQIFNTNCNVINSFINQLSNLKK